MSVGIKIARTQPLLNHEVEILQRLKSEAEAASLRFEEQQATVIKMMEAQGRKTLKTAEVKATLVERVVPKYDEHGLRKALGAPMWTKVTKKVLDKVKLEKMVDEGEIDLNVVAQYATVTPSKPYIRFSAVTPDDDE